MNQINKNENYSAMPVPILAPDRLPKPLITCMFSVKQGSKGWVLVDTGAAVSMVNSSALTSDNHVIVGKRTKIYNGAGGSPLPLSDDLVDVKLFIPKCGFMWIKNAIVCLGRKSTNSILMGVPDIKRMGMTLDFDKNEINFQKSHLKGIRLKMPTIKSLASQYEIFTHIESERQQKVANESVFGMFENMVNMVKQGRDLKSETKPEVKSEVKSELKNEKSKEISPEDPDKILADHSVESDGLSTFAMLGDPCIHQNNPDSAESYCAGCDKCTDPELKKILEMDKEHPPALNNPNIDRKAAILAYIERIRDRDRNTFTHGKCTIGKELEESDPELAKAIRLLIKKHKRIFSKDIGRLSDEYQVKGYINENSKFSIQRPGHSPFEGTTLLAVMKQFSKLLAHGVIRPIGDLGVEPKNVLMVLPVKKKNDDGEVLNVMNALRIVVNSKPTNKFTSFFGQPTDNLSNAINFAALTSEKGLNAKVDICKAYFNIPLHPSLYPYFCIDVPIIGRCHFTALVQGWAPSAQICEDTFSSIFFSLSEWLRKYMDDFILAVLTDRTDYLRKLNQFFGIIEKEGLKLNGEKCFFGVKSFNYLGVKIDNGKIRASPHFVMNLKNTPLEKIKTKTDLKSFLASVRFLARFQNRSTDLLKVLNDESKGEKNEVVIWTENLKLEFGKVIQALSELSELHPFNPKLQTVLVVDTSKVATGGFMYQVSENGPKLIMFFSRTRRDKERKIPISSCHMEMLGLKAMVYAFMEMLRQCELPVTVVTDSRSVVKVFEHYKKGDLPSEDTILNNAVYAVVSLIHVNVVHANNTNNNIKFSDSMSRLGLFVQKETCEGKPKCSICAAADPDSFDYRRVVNAINENYKLGLNHGNLLVSSKEDGIDLPKDSEIFKIRTACFQQCCHLKEDFKYLKLKELLDNSSLIRSLQSKDKILFRLHRDLLQGVLNYPKSDQRLQTLLETRRAKIENGYLRIDKVIDGLTYRVIPLPKEYGLIAINAIHNTFGHMSITQMSKHVARHFQFENQKEAVRNFVQNCIKCTLLRGGTGYDRLDRKPVPVPTQFYQSILVDEVTRTFKGKVTKFMLGMEALSGFMVCVVYKNSMTAELFLVLICKMKMMLCPHNMDSISMTVRCDQATWHTSNSIKTAFELLNIELSVYNSSTNSKNIIPELDARIKIYSQYLSQLVEDSPFSVETCCYLAAAKTNNSIGQHGYTPAEMFVGRRWPSGNQFKMEAKELIKSIKDKRFSRRQYEERKAAERYLGDQRKFIPYANKALNAPLVNNPKLIELKIGDIISLKEKVNKNEPRFAYRIEKIDFPKNKALVRRYSGMDKNAPQAKWIDFRIIHSVASQPKDMNLLEKTDLDYLISDATSALNEIVYLNDSFSVDIHHSVGQLEDLRICNIRSLSVPDGSLNFELEI